jgi:hypothetical protein
MSELRGQTLLPGRLTGASLEEELMTSATTLEQCVSSASHTKALARMVEPVAFFEEPNKAEVKKLEGGPAGYHNFIEQVNRWETRYEALDEFLKELDSPLEAIARERVLQERDAARSNWRATERSADELKSKIDAHIKHMETGSMLAAKYPLMEIDKMLWGKGAELLMVPILTSSNSVYIEVKKSRGYKNEDWYYVDVKWPARDRDYMEAYEPLARTLEDIFTPFLTEMRKGQKDNLKHTYAYKGAIPASVKKSMKAAEKDFIEEGGFLILIADTALLEMTEGAIFPDPDPIIVGYHPLHPKYLWLVDSFDMTPIEKAITDEALARFAALPREG